MIWKLRYILPRHSLITIYKSFVRPILNYFDIFYDQPNNEGFCNKIERLQYNVALAVTGAIRGTSQTKLYNELGLESLKFRRWMRRLCMFHQIKTLKLPEYLYNLISNDHQSYNTRNNILLKLTFAEQVHLNIHFFPIPFLNGKNLTLTCTMLNHTQSLLKIGRSSPNHIYKIHDPLGLKLLTRLRLGLSHLNEPRFNHNFHSCRH